MINYSDVDSKLIEELQIIEHGLQHILAQKQVFQVESQEIKNALEEVKKTKDDIYKTFSGIMIKANKKSLIAELEEREKVIGLRISSLEKQEENLQANSLKLRNKMKSYTDKIKN